MLIAFIIVAAIVVIGFLLLYLYAALPKNGLLSLILQPILALFAVVITVSSPLLAVIITAILDDY